jgi:hypothetical protein
VEEIRVSNIVMKNIREQAMVLDLQYAKTKVEPVSERTPRFRNIHFSNITGQVNQAAYLNGLEEMPIENITFSDINLDAKSGFNITNANRIELHNVQVNSEIGAAVIAAKVNFLTIDNVKSYTPLANSPIIDLRNVNDAFIYNANPFTGTGTYLRLSGADTKNISLGNNNFRNAKTSVSKEAEVKEEVKVLSGDK